jgi:hypothetical protein
MQSIDSHEHKMRENSFLDQKIHRWVLAIKARNRMGEEIECFHGVSTEIVKFGLVGSLGQGGKSWNG